MVGHIGSIAAEISIQSNQNHTFQQDLSDPIDGDIEWDHNGNWAVEDNNLTKYFVKHCLRRETYLSIDSFLEVLLIEPHCGGPT